LLAIFSLENTSGGNKDDYIYDIMLILQYQVSTTVMDLVVVFALFVFMLALLCSCVAAVFTVNKDLYKTVLSALCWAVVSGGGIFFPLAHL